MQSMYVPIVSIGFVIVCWFEINVSDVKQSSIHNANHAIIDNR